MRTLKFLLEKEFRQIFRNKIFILMMILVPTMQLIILPLAANYEVKNINLAVVDLDRSDYSRMMISKINSSGYFHLTGYNTSFEKAFKLIEQDKADLILEIPNQFETKLVRENEQKVFIAVNAINGTKANLGGAYLKAIIRNFNSDIRYEWLQPPRKNSIPTIDIVTSAWFNPYMNYKMYMVPGILAILVTLVGGYISSLNIVKEKEVGTIEQINVTPIKKHHFILGKLIPFWAIGMIVFLIGLIISRLIYSIVPLGSLLTLFGFLAIYLVSVLGFGLLISTYTDTQQQAMFVAFFFVMIFILMGGLFTSIDSMPLWAKVISKLNPVTYFIEVMRMIILKGSGLEDIKYHLLIVVIFAIVFNGWAIINHKKTS